MIPQDPAIGIGYDLFDVAVATSLVDPTIAYFSYYSGGFRVARIINDELVEIGHFIDDEGNNFWGIEAFMHEGEEYVAASDRDHGLYIFKLNP